MSSYPQRDQFWAHMYCRRLFKSCACQTIGHRAVLLCVHIAHTEDAARYQGPVMFWNSQLMETLGFSSRRMLDDARDRAVQGGWLVYERPHDRAVGQYWTVLPSGVGRYDDRPIEEPVTCVAGDTRTDTRTYTQTDTQTDTQFTLRNTDPPVALSDFVFPLIGGQTWTLPLDDVQRYSQRFEHLDVPRILRHIQVWCEENPKNRKTGERGMRRCIVGWLGRCQDSGRDRKVDPGDGRSKTAAERLEEKLRVHA